MGRIRLRVYLFRRRVPDVNTPLCQCGAAEETVCHLIVDCQGLTRARRSLGAEPRSARDLRELLGCCEGAAKIAWWVLSTGRLQEYRLAMKLDI